MTLRWQHALLLLLVSGCGSDSGTQDPNPESRWQPLGRDSAAAGMFARIDGASWGSDETPLDTIADFSPPEQMHIAARVVESVEEQGIALQLRFTGVGTYPVTVTPISVADASFNLWPADSLTESTTYYAGPGTSGFVTVTVWDEATQRIEGKFQFTAVRVGGNPTEPDAIGVTHGVFRGYYRLH